MANKEKNIRVIKDAINPETAEVLAASLIKIADGFEALISQGELTEGAIVILLCGMPGMNNVSKREVAFILQNLKKLKSYYVRAKAK